MPESGLVNQRHNVKAHLIQVGWSWQAKGEYASEAEVMVLDIYRSDVDTRCGCGRRRIMNMGYCTCTIMLSRSKLSSHTAGYAARVAMIGQ